MAATEEAQRQQSALSAELGEYQEMLRRAEAVSERQMLELRRLQHKLKQQQQQQDSSRGAQGGDLSAILGAWLGRAPADETPSDKAPPTPTEPSFPAPPLSQLR